MGTISKINVKSVIKKVIAKFVLMTTVISINLFAVAQAPARGETYTPEVGPVIEKILDAPAKFDGDGDDKLREAGERIRIIGLFFGDGSGANDVVKINGATYTADHSRVKSWTNTKIVVKLPWQNKSDMPGVWYNSRGFKWRKVWVTANGLISDNPARTDGAKRFKMYPKQIWYFPY